MSGASGKRNLDGEGLASTILVLGHNYPYSDLDSLVSSIALADLLTRQGREARAALLDPARVEPETLRILGRIGLDLPQRVGAGEVTANQVALADHNNPRESFGQFGLSLTPVLVVDHHLNEGLPATQSVIRSVGATATLVAEMARDSGLKFGALLARALVYAIAYDTLALRSKKTTPLDHEMIAYLQQSGPVTEPLAEILRAVIPDRELSGRTDSELASASLKEYLGGRLGIAVVPVSDESYRPRLDGILAAGDALGYPLYGLMVVREDRGETEVYWRDRAGCGLPPIEHAPGLLSRAQDVAPRAIRALEQTAGGGAGVAGGVRISSGPSDLHSPQR